MYFGGITGFIHSSSISDNFSVAGRFAKVSWNLQISWPLEILGQAFSHLFWSLRYTWNISNVNTRKKLKKFLKQKYKKKYEQKNKKKYKKEEGLEYNEGRAKFWNFKIFVSS